MLRINNRCHQCGKPWASYDVKIECPYDRDGDREVVIRHLCKDCGSAYVKALDTPQDHIALPVTNVSFTTEQTTRMNPTPKRRWWPW